METTTKVAQNGQVATPSHPYEIEIRVCTKRAIWARPVSVPILPFAGLKVQIYSDEGERAEETLGDIVVDERSGQLYTWLTDGQTYEHDEVDEEILSFIGWGFQLWADGLDTSSEEDIMKVIESMAAIGRLESVRYGYYKSAPRTRFWMVNFALRRLAQAKSKLRIAKKKNRSFDAET